MKILRPHLTAVNIFVAIALVFGVFFVFTTPLLWGADETSHVGRVYQLSQGHAFAHVVHEGYSGYGFGGEIPGNLNTAINYVNYDINVNTHQVIKGVKWVDQPADYSAFAKLPLSGKLIQYNFSNTAIYSPISYAPSVVAFWLAEAMGLHLGPTIYLGRIFNLLFYVITMAFVLRSLVAVRAKWALFAVALLPMALYQASTITADAVTNTLAFALVGLVLKALITKEGLKKTETIILLSCTVALPVAKPSYLFIALLPLIIPAIKLPVRHIQYRRFVLPLAAFLGICAYGVWQYKTNYLSNSAKYMIAGVVPWWQTIDSTGQMKYVLTHPFSFIADFIRTIFLNDNVYFESLFGRLGFDYVQVPALAIVSSFSALVLAVAASEPLKQAKKVVLVVAALLAVSVLAVFGILYLTISSVGQSTIEGVQGRYLLPMIPILLLLIMCTTKIRFNLSGFHAYRRLAFGVSSLTAASLLFSAVKFYYITWG